MRDLAGPGKTGRLFNIGFDRRCTCGPAGVKICAWPVPWIGSRNLMSVTPRVFWQCLTHPAWSLAVLAHGGRFRFKNLEPYSKASELQNISEYIGSQLNGSLTWDYLHEIRKAWDGPMVLKGLLHDVRILTGLSAQV